MPEWFDPIANTSLATGIIGFILWGISRIVKFLAPKVTAIAEGHVATMDKLGEATIRQTSLMERQTGMLNDHSTTLNVHGQILNVHSEQLRNIAETVGARMARQLPQNPGVATVTMQPAVEVDSSGNARSVVVATEVIHSPKEPPNSLTQEKK